MKHTEEELEIRPCDFEINDLQTDSQHQASLYQYYGGILADEEEDLSRLELQLEQTSAEKELAERKRANDANLKITESHVKAFLAQDEDLVAIREAIISQEHTVATLKTAVKALEQKGQRLSDLVKLEVNKLYNDSSTIEASANSVRNQLNRNA